MSLRVGIWSWAYLGSQRRFGGAYEEHLQKPLLGGLHLHHGAAHRLESRLPLAAGARALRDEVAVGLGHPTGGGRRASAQRLGLQGAERSALHGVSQGVERRGLAVEGSGHAAPVAQPGAPPSAMRFISRLMRALLASVWSCVVVAEDAMAAKVRTSSAKSGHAARGSPEPLTGRGCRIRVPPRHLRNPLTAEDRQPPTKSLYLGYAQCPAR